MSKQPRNNGFSDVDNTKEPQAFVRCMDAQYTTNSILRRQKARVLASVDIQMGHKVLDVGCGTGVDAVQMAQHVGLSGQVIGVDFSQEMVNAAIERSRDLNLPLTFQQGSIYDLSFENSAFDRCRADKTFQHLHEPKAALKELIRVTKPGGKIVVSDPDHDSLIIDTPFADINHRFARFRSSHMVQGGIAHQQFRLFKKLGLKEVKVEPLTAVYNNYDEKKASSPYLEEIWYAQKMGAVTEAEAQQWSDYCL